MTVTERERLAALRLAVGGLFTGATHMDVRDIKARAVDGGTAVQFVIASEWQGKVEDRVAVDALASLVPTADALADALADEQAQCDECGKTRHFGRATDEHGAHVVHLACGHSRHARGVDEE